MNPQDKELLDLYNSLSEEGLLKLSDEDFSEYERLAQMSSGDTIPQSETVQTQAASFTPGTEQFQAKSSVDEPLRIQRERTNKINQFEAYWDSLPLEEKTALMIKYTGRNEPEKIYQQIAGFPNQALQAATAEYMGESEPGALDRFISGAKDVFGGAGRLVGATADVAMSPRKAVNEKGGFIESLSKRGGEQSANNEQRGTVGGMFQDIIRDPLNVPLAATGVPLAKAGTKALFNAPKAMRIGAIGAAEGGLDATLHELEQLQRTGDPVQGANIAQGSLFGAVAPTVLGNVGEVLGPVIKKNAVGSLGQKLKFTPTDQMKRFSPEISKLFENDLIPMTGGARGIYEKLDDAIKQAAEIRKSRVKELSSEAVRKGESLVEGAKSKDFYPDEKTFGEIEKLTINLDQLKNDVSKQLKDEVVKGKIREPLANDIMMSVNKEIGDLSKFSAPGSDKYLLPEQFLNRRSMWFDEGKINPQTLSEFSPADRQASARMWESSSPMLHNLDQTISSQTSQLRDLLPLEKSLFRKLPAIENAYSMLTIGGLSGEAMRASRNLWSANPLLKARYGLGNTLENFEGGFGAASLPAQQGILRETRERNLDKKPLFGNGVN